MKSLLALVIIGMAAAPAYAGPLRYAAEDAAILEEELAADAQSDAWQAQDAADMQSADLIPAEAAGQSSSARSDPFAGSTHVVIRVDGIPIELSDVPRDAWFAPYVRAIAEEGIVSGYRDASGQPLGLFGPADDVTVEQLAKIAVQASGLSGAPCASALKNSTADGRWSAEFFRCAEGAGWTVFSDGAVDAERPATRAEVVVTLLQAFQAPFGTLKGDVFTDVDSTTSYAPAVEAAAEAGMVSGYTDQHGKPTGAFGPGNAVNRAEVAKMVTLAMQLFGK